MQYENPVILSDYSSPDVIRLGGDFYMAASSYNYVPGIPLLHSKNLVEWEIINYILPLIPFERFNKVQHGDGAWAPTLRYHDGKFYCLISFPNEGIFVSEANDPYGKWSLIRPLLVGKGFIDPCPIWAHGKCFVAFAFEKSRTGFNSRIAVFETDSELKTAADKYAYVYDGHDHNPEITGPKFYRRDNYFYILAPAGGVSSGWQTALRSEKIYGPYESKIILTQGETDVNGPHNGALVDLDDEGKRWAFVHFQDMGAYGKVIHLQPVQWINDWPLCGEVNDEKLPGRPARFGEYPVKLQTGYVIDPNDEFDSERLSLKWQTPANPADGWYSFKKGLKLNCVYYNKSALSDLPQMFMQKICYANFSIKCKCRLNLLNDGDEVGLTVFGKEYSYICVVRAESRNYLEIRKGEIGGEEDETLCRSQPYDDNYVTFQISAKREEPNRLVIKYTFGGSAFTRKFYAVPGIGTGAKLGIYARSGSQSGGYGIFKFFRMTCTDNRVN